MKLKSLVVLHVLMIAFLISAKSTAASEPWAEVVKIQGEAKIMGDVNTKANTQDKILKLKDHVMVGSIVAVSDHPGDMIDLRYSNGHLIRLTKATKIKIESMDEKSTNKINLLYGQIFAYVVKSKDPEAIKFKIETKSAVAGVRGTKFYMQESDKGSYLCVCEGAVEYAHADDLSVKKIVKAGYDLWARPDKALGEPKSSLSMKEMNDPVFKDMGL